MGSGSRSKNCCSHFKLILCSFLPISGPHTKFPSKRTKIKICYWPALIGQSKNSQSYFKLNPCCFKPNKSPWIKLNQNWIKNTEVEKIRCWWALVGQLVWSRNSRSHSKQILCCSLPNVTPITNFIQIGWKIQKFKFLKFSKHKKDFKNPPNLNYWS